jgi:hypothetical protein
MKLRDYQEQIGLEAVTLLQTYGIAYLAMEVRTGKTLTALYAAQQYGAKNVLFVTKKKAISSIESDAKAIGIPYGMTVLNYEQLPSIAVNYETFENEYDLIICDEAHCIGAYPKPSERARNLLKIVQDKPLILLSGTPSPESYSQLYHQLWISSRSPWNGYPNFYKWAKDYVRVIQKRFSHGLVNDYSKANKEKIDSDTAHLFITYSQQDAGFTEFVEEEVIFVNMKDTTYKFADNLKTKRVITNKVGETVLANTEVSLMQKLHQIYSGTVIIDDPKRTSTVFDSTKADFIKDRFRDMKIAIYYKFIAEEIMLRAAFGSRIASTPEDFNAGDKDAIYISQILSGREGINLASADCIVMLNIDFAAVSYWQVRARLQTRDRATAAKVYWIFATGGIEEKIYKAVYGKRDYSLSYFKRDFGVANTKQPHQEAA